MKGGGGGNAREIRIRKTKKKGTRKDDDSDDESGPPAQSTNTHLIIMTLVMATLVLSDCLDIFSMLVLQHIKMLCFLAFRVAKNTTSSKSFL